MYYLGVGQAPQTPDHLRCGTELIGQPGGPSRDPPSRLSNGCGLPRCAPCHARASGPNSLAGVRANPRGYPRGPGPDGSRSNTHNPGPQPRRAPCHYPLGPPPARPQRTWVATRSPAPVTANPKEGAGPLPLRGQVGLNASSALVGR